MSVETNNREPVARRVPERRSPLAALVLLGLASVVHAQVPGFPRPRDLRPIQVVADVLESDGAAVQEPLELLLRFPTAGVRFRALATPVDGRAIFEFYVDTYIAAEHEAHPELWLGSTRASPERSSQFFLDPVAGRAAFPRPLELVFNSTAGRYEAHLQTSLSEPPRYGQILISGGSPAGVRLVVGDVMGSPNAERVRLIPRDGSAPAPVTPDAGKEPGARPYRVIPEDYQVPVPALAEALPIYRWSFAASSEVNLRGPLGVIVAGGRLRRGGSLRLVLASELQIDLQLSEARWSEAHRVIIVKSDDHHPNPDRPSGSDRTYREQCKRSVCDARTTFTDGLWAGALRCTGGTYVAELWGLSHDPVTRTSVHRLLSSAPVPTGQTLVSVTF